MRSLMALMQVNLDIGASVQKILEKEQLQVTIKARQRSNLPSVSRIRGEYRNYANMF